MLQKLTRIAWAVLALAVAFYVVAFVNANSGMVTVAYHVPSRGWTPASIEVKLWQVMLIPFLLGTGITAVFFILYGLQSGWREFRLKRKVKKLEKKAAVTSPSPPALPPSAT